MIEREQTVVEDAQEEFTRLGRTPISTFISTLELLGARWDSRFRQAWFRDTNAFWMVELLCGLARTEFRVLGQKTGYALWCGT